jgi:hypothetical protein
LMYQKEADAGSAEVQPARNTFGCLSIHYDSAPLRGFIIFFVSFILYDLPFMLTR